MNKKLHLLLILFFTLSSITYAQRQVEKLNRGIIAIRDGNNSAYIGWRLLGLENNSISFNLYKSVGGADNIKCNSAPITTSTNFRDTNVDYTKDNIYTVKSIMNGVEENTGESYTLTANTIWRQYFPITLQQYADGVYDVVHVYAGDIDGDGDFDYIVKRVPQDATYNTIKLECYDNTGKFLWMVDLGSNQETYIATMTAPVLVADFDGNGKAEIITRTYEGTTFGDGTTIGDTNNDGKTDYNSHAGSGTYANVMAGPEFISLIDGETGKELDRNSFISRDLYSHNASGWGDNYGARVNFIMSSIGSFDGVKPGAVFSRGHGACMVVETWNVVNGKLNKLWNWSSKGKSFAIGGWTDFHQIQCIDVDGDGKDEISWGACMMNPNGTVRYTTKYVHGDRFQITDINPNRSGLEVFIVQQNNGDLIGSALYDASTGKTIKDWYISAVGDIGRGDVADIDPNSPGMEMFDVGSPNLHAADGSEAVMGSKQYPDVSIWWDADLLRENFKGIGSSGTNPAINKWNYTTNGEERLFTVYNDGGSYVLICPYAGRAAFIGDILGDWREEFIVEKNDHSEIRIYTTKDITEHKLYTLQQNPAYRNAVSSKGYLCSKYTDYFLGAGMSTPPTPNIIPVGVGTIVKSITLKATAGDGVVDLSWTLNNFSGGVVEITRDTDADPAGRGRIAYVTNGATSYSDTDVVNGTTYYYWIKITLNGESINSDAASATPKDPNATGITKCGAGSSIQTVNKGESITAYCFTWTGATSVTISGMPKGINVIIDNANKKVDISGTADDEAGEYPFTITTVGGNPDSTRGGKITILSDNTTNVLENKNEIFNINITPNPVEEIASVYIHAEKSCNYDISITNINGSVIFKNSIFLQKGKNEFKLNFENLNSGLYFLNVFSNDESVIKKVIKK